MFFDSTLELVVDLLHYRSRSYRRLRMLRNNAYLCSDLHQLFEYL